MNIEEYGFKEYESIKNKVGMPARVISTYKGRYEVVCEKGKTIVLLGSSGVGKSTLVNALSGKEIMKTSDVRESDSRGKHTTTNRKLLMLPNGAMVIDTPSMRELGIYEADVGLNKIFEDIDRCLGKCKCLNCTHISEQGWKVLEALENGEITQIKMNIWKWKKISLKIFQKLIGITRKGN